MTQSKHTPGPWVIKHNPSNLGALERYEILSESSGDFVAAIRYYHAGFSQKGISAEDDARLIAAAPELLEALRECIAARSDTSYTADDICSIYERADAAIAKAQGGAE